jgi:hypothetical protein
MVACHRGGAPPLPPTSAPSCAVAAEHVRLLIGPERPRAAKIRDVLAARCDADGWSPEARMCMATTESLRKPQHCKAMLTIDQHEALDLALDALALRVSASRIPQACNEYQTLLDRLGTCAAIPPQMHPVLVQTYRDILREWARRATPDATILAARCSAMADTLRKAVAPPCGW